MDKYHYIYKEYNSTPDTNDTKEIKIIFEKANEIDFTNGINDILIKMLFDRSYTINQIDYIIELGADLTYGQGLHFVAACRSCNKDVIQLFLDRFSPNVQLHNEKICENICRRMGYITGIIELVEIIEIIEIIKLLLNVGFILDNNLLGDLVKNGSVDIINTLLDCGIPFINMLDVYIAHKPYSDRRRNVMIIIDKIKSMPNLNLPSTLLSELLKLFMHNENISLEDIEMMISLGADPRYENDIYLIKCCRWSNVSVPMYFVDVHQCNINAHNSEALHRAIMNDCIENINYLLNNGAKVTDGIINYIIRDRAKYIKLLIEHDISLDYVINLIFGNMPLNEKLVIMFLLEHGVDMLNIITNTLGQSTN